MNTFGNNFRISIYGESHGPAIGIIIDGVPPGIPLSADDFANDLERRKPGAKGTTTRIESDEPILCSGVFNGYTTAAPLHIQFANQNTRSEDYNQIRDIPRPGHADFVVRKKYQGFNDYRGGGHFSGRLTLPLVAAGVIAKKIIDPVGVHAFVSEAGGSTDIENSIQAAIEQQDSIGGIIKCRVSNVPVGLGEPFFNSVESMISHLIFSIPAVKGIEFGSGFAAAAMKGSEHNDMILDSNGRTATNHAGGINGGISNGNEIEFQIAVKPTSSISMMQESINLKSDEVESFLITGRHDVCIALRVPVIAEAMTAIAFAELQLSNG
jgi:chorismate synthase